MSSGQSFLSINKDDFKFFLNVRVNYSQVEAQQVVYFGSYFDFFEAARQEYWHRLGIKLEDLKKNNMFISVVETACRYFKPAYYDDMLDVHVRTSEMRDKSFDLDYLIIRRRDNETIAAARTTFVIIDTSTYKACEVPGWIRKATEQFEGQ